MKKVLCTTVCALLLTSACRTKTHVVVHVIGTCAIINQQDPKLPRNSLSVIIPKVTKQLYPNIHDHIAYIAWQADEVSTFGTYVKEVIDHGPSGPSTWRVHPLDPLKPEEISIENDLANNQEIPAPANHPCSPDPKHVADLNCIVTLSSLLPSRYHYDDDYVRRVKPSADKIAGRFEILHGTVTTLALDECPWGFKTKNNSSVLLTTKMAGEMRYEFEIDDDVLQLRTRDLDKDPKFTSNFVYLKASPTSHQIDIRIGNAPGIFPPERHLIPMKNIDPHDNYTEMDPHYSVYYDFLTPKIDEGDRPVPFRDKTCKRSTPTINCGPGHP